MMHATAKLKAEGFDPIDTIFSLMLDASWLRSERFRSGIRTLVNECKTEDDLAAIVHLIRSLRYCTSKDLEEAAIDAAYAITASFNLDPANTLLVGLAEGRRTCGSIAYLRAIETKLPRSWGGSIWTTFDAAFRQRANKPNLVIVDDFVGTGEKILTRIARLRANPKTADYVIHVTAFAGMNEGLSRVADDVDNLIHAHEILEKSIAAANPPSRRGPLYLAMQSLEANFFQKPGEYSLGYKQSEAAFFLEGANIPNNNFPVLWWEEYADKSSRSTLFYRR